MNLYNPMITTRTRTSQGIPQEPVQPMEDTPNTIESEFHTLFMEEIPVSFNQLILEDGPVDDIFEKVGGYNIYKLFLGVFDDIGKGTQKLINKLQQSNHTALELHISSEGGSFDELVEYYDVVSSYFSGVTSFLSFGYSAGAIAFLFGEERVVYEHSSWMTHSYAGGAYGKRDDMLTQLKHSDDRIQKFFDKMLSPYFSKKEMKKMAQGKDYWMNSEQMLERGIATSIIIDGESLSAQEYLENLYPERKDKRLAKEAKKAAKKEKKENKTQKVENE